MITTVDGIADALMNRSSRLVIAKASIAGQTTGSFASLWRATGQPGQGAIPAAAAVCSNTTLGGIDFTQQTAPAASYLGILEGLNSNAAMTMELHDRLAHMGGLNGTLTTAQTVGIDLQTMAGTSNLAERVGGDYGDVQWWLEWYTATGATVATATVNVTYNDGSTGNLTGVSLPASRPASHMIMLNNLIPAAQGALRIRGVNTVTLSASTATAGSFGVTATRYRGAVFMPIANARFSNDWAALGAPEIANNACLFPVVICATTSTGAMNATGKIMHG
jgi:hypothetical protein